jgi:hypothetical protein
MELFDNMFERELKVVEDIWNFEVGKGDHFLNHK